MLFNDDCYEILKTLPDESVDLVYLDPPFYTQSKQTLRSADGKKYEFLDVWQSRKQYLDYMGVRLREMKRVLKRTGDLFLHCDVSASHSLRVLLDAVFGENQFRSEIIWTYKRWSNSRKGLLPAHQTIFFYSKTDAYKFNRLYGDYSATTNIDQILQARARDATGKAVYKRGEDGEIVASKEKKGVPLSDVWEIPFLNPKAKERTGYPTQKPIELLERIIKISTDPGDCVLDPFCGSGTTLVSAKLLGRTFIGIDVNREAIELCRQRLDTPYKTTSKLLKVGICAYQTKTAEELSILNQFDCDIVQRNNGIDALTKKHYLNAPAAIKIQKASEPFLEAVQRLHTAAEKKGCAFTVLITHETAWEKECAIPPNMIVLPRYETQMKQAIEERLDKAKAVKVDFTEQTRRFYAR